MKPSLGGRAAVMRSLRRRRAGAPAHAKPYAKHGTVLLAAALAAVLAAGCSSSGSTSSPVASQKVKLSFWSWVPNLDKVVAIWNKAHPDIQVQVQVQAGGDAELTKLLTAAKAGNPPDIAQVEYQVLPTLVSSNYLADISKYAGGLSSDFPAGIWNQVTLGSNSVYGIPEDAAPMAFFYRADEFTKYHLTVPVTWAQFAADAKKLHAEAPGVYLGTFSSADPGEFAGLSQQAVNNQPQWTAAWNKGMNDGHYIAWVSDVWAPGDLVSESASNSGKWTMTALPQWTAGGTASGNWGGSSTAVMAASKHQQAAAEFATWLNTSPAATAALASQGGIYPADIAAQATLAAGPPPAYFSNQSDFYSIAKRLAAGTSQVTWGPDVNVAYSEFTTAFGTATTSKGSFLTPLAQLQSTVLNDMKKSGFTVQAAG